MKFVLKGMLGSGELKLFKAAAGLPITVRIVTDDGAPVDLSTGTHTLEAYANVGRTAAPVGTFALTNVTAAAGEATITPSAANTAFGPGTYHVFAKSVVSTTTTISTNSFKLVIG